MSRRFFTFAVAAAAAVLVMSASTRTQTGVTLANFVNFEAAQTNPIRLSPDGTRLFAVNTPDARVSVFDVSTSGDLTLFREVPVGIEPVSVNPRTRDEAWVVNQVSDSISIVSVDAGIVTDTISVKDEPADVVFAGSERQWAFVSVARSNEVRVFHTGTHAHLATIPLQGEQPRALAVSADGSQVYVAFALSGNKTTIIPASAAPPQPAPANPSLPPPPQVSLIVDAEDPAWAPGVVGYTMPDHDVAVIDAAAWQVTQYISGVGTVNLGITVHPGTGDLYVTNTEARNLARFEPNLRGHIVDNRVTRVGLAADGLIIAPADLNPTIDYSVLPNESAKASAVAQPTAVVAEAASGDLFIAAFGTDRVARVSTTGAINTIDLAGAAVNSRAMRGPRGLAFHAAARQLYVLNRLSNTIAIVDTVADAVRAEIPVGIFDPTPQVIREGRGFLYDAKLSGNGTAACAACHVDGDIDMLAWDLGNPNGSMQTVNSLQMHPMKGPMTTQTLRGLNTLQPFHWRGDRADFLAFNPAFDGLMGGTRLADADMAAYRDFIDTIRFQPNPNQKLDRTLPAALAGGDPIAGRNTFRNEPFVSGVTCNTCHTESSAGTNRTIIPGAILQESQPFKVPHLRNLYQKTNFSKTAGAESVGGFGFLHDGSTATLFEFLSAPVFGNLSNDTLRKRNVAAFLLAFDTGTAPAVGYARTLTTTSVTAAASDWSLLEQQAAVSNIDLIAKGTIDGQVRGLLFRPGSQDYQTDKTGVGPFIRAQLQEKVLAGDVLTVMGVFPGTGARMGIDRNMDGVLDDDVGAPPPPPPPPPDPTAMHVADILTTNATGEPQTTFRRRQTVFWRVQVVDQAGMAVGGATVTTDTSFGSTVIATSTATTGGDGWALFSRLAQIDPTGTYTITVTTAEKTDALYDPASNVKTSTTYTLRR